MGWPEVSIEDFPPERDDEPASLRQDILDELMDHFACALNRELLKNPDERLAKERVLNQFGDPIKIARQLWFDGMKEKIMSQRIMTGVSIVMAVCCIAVVGVAWSMMNQNQSINQKMLEQLAAIADRPQPVAAMNQDREILKLLDELKQNQREQNRSSAEEMNPIFFQLVQEGNIEKPAIGFSGYLTKDGGKTDSFSLSVVSDKSGKLDFGKLPWGRYLLRLQAPWKERTNMFNFSFTTIPGRSHSETIVCPATPPVEVPVQFQVIQTGKATGEWDYLLCDFRHHNPKTAAVKFVLTSSRKVQNLEWSSQDDLQKDPEQGVYLIDIKNNQVISYPLTAEGEYKNIDLAEITWEASVKTFQGKYQTPVIYLIRKRDLSKLSELNSLKPFGLITGSLTKDVNRLYTKATSGMFLDPFEILKVDQHSQKVLATINPHFMKHLHGVKSNNPSLFIAALEQPNVWEIKIPEMQLSLPESDSLTQAR